MSSRNRLQTSPRLAGLLAAAWLMTLAPNAMATTPPDADHDAAEAASEMNRILADRVDMTIDSDDGHVIEVRIVGGKATVRLDGHAVPESRLRREAGRIVILGEDGREIDTVPFGLDGGDKVFFGPGQNRFFGLEQNQWQNAFRDFVVAQPQDPPKAMIGIHLGAPGPALEHHLRLDPGSATMITGVYEGLPAHEAGLHEFDVIVAIDGESPADPDSLRKQLAAKDIDAKVELRVIQKGQSQTVIVKLVAYDAAALAEAMLMGHRAGPAEVDLEQFGGPGGVFWTLPGNRRALIAPGTDDVFIGVPDLDARIREEIERNLPKWRERTDRPGTDQERQIDRLERRLQELTERLNKLLEDRDR